VSIEVMVHDDVTPGGCRAVTRHGEIDLRIETQLARIEQELLD
jgi:flagellar biosynthesis/type III secretory pathway protein FliH